jgi:small-conductance mechanosensitive channel
MIAGMDAMAAVSLPDLSAAKDVSGWDVVLAAISIAAAWLIGRLAQHAVRKTLGRLEGVGDDLRQLTGRLVKYFVLVIGFGVALWFLGASVQPLLAAAIVIAVVFALALHGIANNFAAGVVIQTRRPLQIGDQVESLGYEGTVVEVNGRAVVVKTDDGQLVHLPNAKVLDSPIVNNSAHGMRRSEVEVRSARSAGPDKTMAIVTEVTGAVAGIAAEPPPKVLLSAVEPERVIVRVSVWHAPGAGGQVTTTLVRELSEALLRRDIAAAVVTPPPPTAESPSPPL